MSSPKSESTANGLSTLFFRNRYLLVLTLAVILIGGLSAMRSLPRLEDPRITNRNPLIITPVPGASAERVESQVTEILEEALQEISAIQSLESRSRAGISLIAVELDADTTRETNQEVFSEIRSKLDDAAPRLPDEARAPIVDDKRDPAAFTLILALRWRADRAPLPGMLARLGEDLADRLRTVSGTELVRLYGDSDEEILVSVDSDELAELGLSVADLSQKIAASDAKGAAGVLRSGRSDVLLEVEGELDSLQRIAAIPVASGTLVRLGDIATIERQVRTPENEIALIDGDRSVLVAARMSPDRRIDRWAGEVGGIVDEFSASVGAGVDVEAVFEQERYTSKQLSELGFNLVAGALVVIVVVLLMMGWRLALIVGAALPLVVSIVLFGWQLSGGALQQMSIFGLIIALGLLIDNAIVVADEVQHQRNQGVPPLAAVDRSVRHLFLPLLASTLTTVLAFAPILLLPGGVGDFVGSIGSSVILSIVASFAVAMTLTAALAGLFSRVRQQQTAKRWPGFWQDGLSSRPFLGLYRRGLSFAFRQPAVALAIALFLPLAGFLAARSLGNEFFPPVDRDMFHVQMWLPTDSAIEHTLSRSLEVENAIREHEGTDRVFWLIGGNFPSVYYNLVMRQDGAPHFAQAIVTTTPDHARSVQPMIETLQAQLDSRFPDAQIIVRQFGQGPPIFADVEFRLFGPSIEGMQEIGERVRLALQSHPDVLHSQASLARGEPKLWLRADEDEARLAGLDLGQIAERLNGHLEGGLGGTLLEDLEQMPVRVRLSQEQRTQLDQLATLPLGRNADEDWIQLSDLGALELQPELGGLTRYNGQRTNLIQAFTHNRALPIDVAQSVLADLEASGFVLPPGYRLELGGAVEEDAEAKGNLGTYAPVLATLMVAILILTFRSVALALLLTAVAIFSVGLGLFSTAAAGLPVSFNTILGILGLIGVALNDSIVVLAAVRANPRARIGNVRATVEQVVGSTRHVLSTTLTTIGGFLPLLVFVGGDFWPSLAVVLIGGISGASLLALLFVPASHILIERFRQRSARATEQAAAQAVFSGGPA